MNKEILLTKENLDFAILTGDVPLLETILHNAFDQGYIDIIEYLGDKIREQSTLERLINGSLNKPLIVKSLVINFTDQEKLVYPIKSAHKGSIISQNEAERINNNKTFYILLKHIIDRDILRNVIGTCEVNNDSDFLKLIISSVTNLDILSKLAIEAINTKNVDRLNVIAKRLKNEKEILPCLDYAILNNNLGAVSTLISNIEDLNICEEYKSKTIRLDIKELLENRTKEILIDQSRDLIENFYKIKNSILLCIKIHYFIKFYQKQIYNIYQLPSNVISYVKKYNNTNIWMETLNNAAVFMEFLTKASTNIWGIPNEALSYVNRCINYDFWMKAIYDSYEVLRKTNYDLSLYTEANIWKKINISLSGLPNKVQSDIVCVLSNEIEEEALNKLLDSLDTEVRHKTEYSIRERKFSSFVDMLNYEERRGGYTPRDVIAPSFFR